MKKIVKLFMVLLCLFMVGCGQEEIDPDKLATIYYLNNSETKLEPHDCLIDLEKVENRETEEISLEQVELERKVSGLLAALASTPPKFEYKAPLAMGFQVLDFHVESGKVMVNVSAEYKELNLTTEVLVRAAIVRTLTQLPQINFVAISVEGAQLTDSTGDIVGWMNRDQFIENEGSEINDYQEVKIKLYFANENGDGLIVASRTKEYSTNISMEKLIVDELIKGPSLEGLYPTINPGTKVASVMVKDGICYLNFDETFLVQPYNVTPEVTLYSLANSLAELPNVNKIQISINGDNSVVYREKYNLTNYYERNLDMVLNLEK